MTPYFVLLIYVSLANSLCSIFETHFKSWIVMFSFCLTTWGWWAWNGFLDGVFAKSPNVYAIRDSFTQTWGRDPTWWCTMFLVLSFLGLMELVGKVVQRYMSIAGLLQWPPRRGSSDTNDDPAQWNLAMWQEMEQDPAMQARLRRMARDEPEDFGDDDELLEVLEAETSVVDISGEKVSQVGKYMSKLRQMIPMKT